MISDDRPTRQSLLPAGGWRRILARLSGLLRVPCRRCNGLGCIRNPANDPQWMEFLSRYAHAPRIDWEEFRRERDALRAQIGRHRIDCPDCGGTGRTTYQGGGNA